MAGEQFCDLMSLILKDENILLAYRNIKTNAGNNTPGTDGLTIGDIGRLTPDEVIRNVRYYVQGSPHGYRPKPVRRKEIPKPYDPTKTRPLGIPCIWDRLIQQCVKQVMEPICEAKFSENSYGFRPNRSAEHAISRTYKMMQLNHLHYVVEFDIKGFFDNVNHSKLMRQLWAMGFRDKHLIYVLRQMLSAPIKMENGQIVIPDKGTPQGGIISPLLANVVLNELDHWVDSQWQEHPVTNKYYQYPEKNGGTSRGTGYRGMKTSTELKEMFIVRYADDFRIFCRTKAAAELTKVAITQWLKERLKLEVSPEKTRVVNVRRHYSNFLGFKIKVYPRRSKQVVKSHVADKNLKYARQKLVEQARRIAQPRKRYGEQGEAQLYNSIVMGMQNYYRLATLISADFGRLNWSVMTVLKSRLSTPRGNRLARTGRKLTDYEKERYGASRMLRFVTGTEMPIYPIGCVQHKNPICKKRSICNYSVEGRKGLHDNLRINIHLMLSLMRQPLFGRSAEYADNRISHFSAQWGKCAVTGQDFTAITDIHCHHIIPRHLGGSDKYDNLVLVQQDVHRLIHAAQSDTIAKLQTALKLNRSQRSKLNELRKKAKLSLLT